MAGQEQDPLAHAFSSFDRDAALEWLDGSASEVGENEACAEFVRRLIHSGRLVVQRPAPKRSAKRDAFVDSCRARMLGHATAQTLELFDAHVAGVRIIEEGFQEVLRAMAEGPHAKLAPAAHVWALFGRLATEQNLMLAQMEAGIPEKAPIVDLYSVHAQDGDGNSYRPDAVLAAWTDVLASALLMFGYQHEWFLPSGELVLPAPVELPENAQFQVGLTTMLGQGWRLLDFAQERWRFFGGDLKRALITVPQADGGTRDIPTIEFESELGIDLLDEVAHERMNRIFLEHTLELDAMGAGWPQSEATPTPLAPRAYLTKMEAYSMLYLCHLLQFNVGEDSEEYAGLRWVEWTRAYAWLALQAERCSDSLATISWTREQIFEGMVNAGLSKKAIEAFMEATTFGREHGDLFDAPLLLTDDGRFHCIPGVVSVTNIARAILSHLSTLGCQISRKGRALELRLRELLCAHGHPCVGFKFRRDDEEYECDGACVWDQTLLVFECKNRSLSGGKPSRRFRCFEDIIDGEMQARRVSTALNKYPEVVREHLGDDVRWDKTIECVINGLPFSVPGGIEGVYVSDLSALTRFFERKTVNVSIPLRDKDGNARLVKWPIHAKVWTGEVPSLEDLVRQFEHPMQVESLLNGYEEVDHHWPLSPRLAVKLPLVRLRERSFEDIMRGHGVSLTAGDLLERVRALAGN